MILLTGLYRDPNASRMGEFVECIRRNSANESIAELHIFVEEACGESLLSSYPPLSDPKVRIVWNGRRVTFRDLFVHANHERPGHPVVIANGDIFFDHTLSRLDGYDLTDRLLCLSRWDVGPDGVGRFYDFAGSQDAWIFKAPMRDFPCDFYLGVPGCDNRLAWEAVEAGLALSNPGRSVRAFHLHLSGVRRYTQRQSLPGPTRVVPASYLGTPWLWFVVPCRGRLDDVRQNIGSIVAQPRSTYVLVDYSCPEGTGDWVRTHHPRAKVVGVPGQTCFHGADARNRGAAAVDPDGILCFLDADMEAAPTFSREVLSRVEEGAFLVPDRKGRGFDTALVCSKSAFERVQGYDQTFRYWGEEVGDLRAALLRSGFAERRLPSALLAHRRRRHPRALVAGTGPGRETILAIHGAYGRAKSAIVEEGGGSGLSPGTLREIYRAIAHRHLAESARAGTLPLASVAFREGMGYTLGRLEPGASSHNNDPRPWARIPPSLAGRQYTQVVSGRAAPVEVEFLSSGRLYVLVGTDWEGCTPARAWLAAAGQMESIPPVETRRGTAFEVWSLLGEVGDSYIIPTQVMLVADVLERR